MNSETIYQIIHSILADEATDEERRIFTEWLDASDTNRAEYEKLKRLYQVTTHRSKNKTFNTEFAWQQVHKQTISKKKTFRLPVWTRYAAMVAIIVFTGMIYFSKQPTSTIREVNMEEFSQPTLLLENGEKIALTEESFSMQKKDVVIKNDARNKLVYEPQKETQNKNVQNNHLVIPKGKTYKLLLSDGTKIWLNSETEITYPTRFVGNKRVVNLIGEAFFEVAKNKEKPFIVNANGMEVKVLGTSFNISCYTTDKTFNTTLINGSVSVKTNNKEAQTIVPSEQLTYYKESEQTTIHTVNTELFTSWINGEYIFKDTTLEEIVKKLQRWYDFSVNYEDESLKHNRYSLTADRNTNLDHLLEVISYTSNVKLERINNIINIKKNKEGK
ncbi:FecR family protein [Parabacteroides goldsteinii]|jgi:putative anti-sigma factor|uniref:FecR family protein n=1 Tax=Parabacteroides goldsteinii TaxID=328812 RepID=UPI0024927DE5|nr:FecR family protein [Parabacteroides goldsteinii]